MTPLEINVLKTVISNLTTAKKTTWDKGGIDDWYDHAMKMRAAIQNNIPMLQALIDASTPEAKPESSRDHPLTING